MQTAPHQVADGSSAADGRVHESPPSLEPATHARHTVEPDHHDEVLLDPVTDRAEGHTTAVVRAPADTSTGYDPGHDPSGNSAAEDEDAEDENAGDGEDGDGEDPFAAFVDETPDDGVALRRQLLSRRDFVPMRKEFVQLRRDPQNPSASRASVLHDLVQARQHRALMALLLAHAIAPTLQDDPLLPLATWARMLATPTRPCSTTQASAALNFLAGRRLIERTDHGRQVKVTLLSEDGTGQPWVRAGLGDVGPGFFVIPHALFTDGLLDTLKLPGLAMLLLALHETNQKQVFTIAVDKIPQWYGLSERTGERGYRELAQAEVTKTHIQMVRDGRSPIGLRRVHHRMLLGAYSTEARKALQQNARRAARAGAAKAATPAAPR